MQGGIEGSDGSIITLPASNQDVHLLLKGKLLRHSAHQASGWLAKMYLTSQVDRFSRRNEAQKKEKKKCCLYQGLIIEKEIGKHSSPCSCYYRTLAIN